MGIIIRTSCFIVFGLLLFALALTSSTEKSESFREELILKQLVDPSSGKFDDNKVEELLFNCNLDLIHLNEAFKKLRLGLSKEEITHEVNPKTRSLSLNPQVKQTLLDCLQNRKTQTNSGSKNWFYRRDDVPRRYLETAGDAPAPGPAVRPPALLPSLAPSSDPPATSPRTPFFPPFSSNAASGSPPPTANLPSSPRSNPSGENKGSSSGHKRAVVIAVTVTASVTFFAVALLFLCCGGYCGPDSKRRQNDERPLLSLSISEFSFGGASPQFYRFGNGDPNKEDTISHHNHQQSYSYNNPGHSFGSSMESNFHVPSTQQSVSSGSSIGPYSFKSFEVASSAALQPMSSLLKPPPGRASSVTPTGMPPMRPPPGRAEPLPPEPPSSFKPPSIRPGPPPPPAPPIPPPAFKPIRSPSPSAGPTPPPPPPPRPSPSPPPPPPGPRAPPPPPPRSGGPPPPPPPKGSSPPRPPNLPSGSKLTRPTPPVPPKNSANISSSGGAASSEDEGDDAPKAKLKPFFWDKVMANPDHSMVWHQIKSGSFQFDENMIESLFGYAATDKYKPEQKKESSSQDPSPPQFIQIIDAKKSQNLAILLRALNLTIEEVCDALREGHELPSEFVQNLLKMRPTTEEELKLRVFNGDPSQLGPAERFLKALVDIPSGFKRLEALLFMSTLTEEVGIVKESFQTLEVACKELRNSRLFLKLLEAVLKTGNRMNDGTFRGGAQAFKLDTLLKLADVKGTDGKTTLLHFVVQEIIRSEGKRAVRINTTDGNNGLEEGSDDAEENYRTLGLQAVSSLGNELENVKKASVLDAESLTSTVAKLGQSLLKSRQFLNSEMKSLEEDSGFHRTLKSYVQNAEGVIMGLLEEEKRIMALVKNTGDYFHGNSGKDEGLRLFVVVRDFLIMVDKACREVREASKKASKAPKKESSSSDLRQLGSQPLPPASSSSEPRQSVVDLREKLFPAIADRRMDDSSSDED